MKQSIKKLLKRNASLMPAGIPKYVRCYDNGGKTVDRYTVCYVGRKATIKVEGSAWSYPYVGMSAEPFDPQGFGQHGESKNYPCDLGRSTKNRLLWPPSIGRKCHLGTRIAFKDLPINCQRLVRQDYVEIWELALESKTG